MDPSSRAPLGALLLALLLRALPAPACSRLPPGHRHLFADAPAGAAPLEIGACVGDAPAAPAPADEPPARLAGLTARADWKDWSPMFRDLGYREDAAADRLLGSDGRPVSEPRLARLLAPADAARARIPALAWQHLQTNGYRVDEQDCALKHSTKPPVTNLDIEWLLHLVGRSTEHGALEALKAGLRGLAPGAPVPPELIARLRQMEGAQVRLPEELRRRLFSERPPTVGDVSAPLDSAYAAATAWFDGQRTLDSFVTSARPLGSEGAVPAREPSAMRPEERRLGELLSRELQAVFETTEPGRELLGHFRRPDGTTPLPPLLVLKLTQRPDDPNQPGAIYNHEAREVVMNHWVVQRVLLDQLPERERAARAREFADPAALSRYLEANPEARRRLVENIDFLVLHEFVHYRQGDVAPINEELRRGNVPGVLPLSLEHEAHRQECRYFLSRVAADPSLLTRGYGYDRQQYCPGVLRDPARLENYVTDLYTRTFAGSQLLPEVRRMQAVRRDDALAIMLSSGAGWEERARAALKIVGFEHGDAALTQEEARITAVRDAYDRALGPLREQTAGVPAALLRQGKPYQALLFLSGAGWEGREAQARADVLAAMRLLASRDRRATLEERLGAVNLITALSLRVGASFEDDSFQRAVASDMRAYAAQLRRQAAAASGTQAEDLRHQAEQWEQNARSWTQPRQQVPQRSAPR